MKVSVIIPVYNSSSYIKKCIDSLIKQTLQDVEFLFIDNGSIDNSESIIKSYSDKRIKYFKLKEKGISIARNYGLKKSIGETICFVDSDDYIKEDMLEKMYNKLKLDDLDIVICDYNIINFNSYNIIKEEKLINFNNTTLKETPNLLIDINLGPCNKLFKKELFKDLSFPIKLKYEDFKLVAILFDRAKKIGKINETLCYFTKREKSETTTMDEKVFDLFISFDELLKYFKNKKYVKESLDSLIILKLTDYCLLQKYQKNLKLGYKFIDEAFDYIKNNTINYKSNKCFKKMNFLKRLISKSKNFTKIYCSVYHIFLNSL